MRRQTFAGWLVHRPPAHEGLLQGKNLQKAGQRKQKAVPVEHATLPLLLPPHQPGRLDRLDRSGQLLRLPRSDQSGQLLRLLRSDQSGQLLRLPRSDQLLRLPRSDRWGQLLRLPRSDQLLRLLRSDRWGQLLRSLQLLRLLQLARSDQWDPSVPWGQPVLCSSIRFVWMRCHLILHTS